MPKAPSRARLAAAFGVLGLTPLEAEVYSFLLSESAATGYRVAQAVGKSIGSIYKTLEGLEAKGAVMVSDDPGVRVVRATPLEELLAARRRELDSAAAAARAELKFDAEVEGDELVYRLADRAQVLERAAGMLEGATDFCNVTATPVIAGLIREDLARAAARAVHVGVKVFSPIEIEGVRVVLDPRGADAVARGIGEWLAFTADGREMLIAIFDHRGETLHTATWTRHTHLNWTFFTNQGSNLVLAAVRTALKGGATGEQIEALIASFAPFQTPRSFAKRRLMERFRALPPNPSGRRARLSP